MNTPHSLTVCAGNLDAVGGGEQSAAFLLAGEAVRHVPVEPESRVLEGGVVGVLAAGVAAVQGVADEAPDPLGD